MSCGKTIEPVPIITNVTKPSSPYELLKHFREARVNGQDVMMAHKNVFFILETTLKQYEEECETCPQWADKENKDGRN